MNQNSDEKQRNEWLRSALQNCPEEEELLTEEEMRARGIEPHSFSPDFEKKMNKLLKTQRRKEWLRKHGKEGGLAAAIALLLLGETPDIDDLDFFSKK